MKHEVFEISPIENVTLQVKFPAILLIESDVPSDFQALLRDIFPYYNKQNQISNEVNFEFNINDGVSIIPNPKSVSIVHVFETLDKRFKLELNRDSLTLYTQNYDGWIELNNIFTQIINSFTEIYKIDFVLRIGLRYVNVFVRTKLKYDRDYPWECIINKPYLYVLEDKSIKFMSNTFEREINAEEKSKVRVNMSLVKNVNDPTNEQCLLFDSDYFSENSTPISNVLCVIDNLHNNAYELFTSLITTQFKSDLTRG